MRQTYQVWMTRGYGANASRTNITGPRKLIAVPSNVGTRTMPDYTALAKQGIYTLDGGIRVFAGTVDDPFYIDLGGAFDSLNLRGKFPSGTPGVLTAEQDGNDRQNSVPTRSPDITSTRSRSRSRSTSSHREEAFILLLILAP